jgi:hypothetical protein
MVMTAANDGENSGIPFRLRILRRGTAPPHARHITTFTTTAGSTWIRPASCSLPRAVRHPICDTIGHILSFHLINV